MSPLQFPIQLFLQSRGKGSDLYALGAKDLLVLQSNDLAVWDRIQSFIDVHEGQYIFFALSYELKDHVESLSSENSSYIQCPLALLFTAEAVLSHKEDVWQIETNQSISEDSSLIAYVQKHDSDLRKDSNVASLSFESQGKIHYLDKILKTKEHIQHGDIYEMNYCQEFRLKDIHLDPLLTYTALLERTNAPYSAYLCYNGLHLLCASPESYLEKKGNTVISRPIKGTRRRHKDPVTDDLLKIELQGDTKERAENIMICDLVRNDLSRVAEKDSVEVTELCKVYSFDTVHQMISTVECKVSEHLLVTELLKATFPMGSMTGAPKVRAMELIEELEDFKRGWFSGTLGYISPNGDLKSNVVIRSILYDEKNHKASIAAGGAITSLSDPEKEYEESLLKASALKEVLSRQARPIPPPTEREN